MSFKESCVKFWKSTIFYKKMLQKRADREFDEKMRAAVREMALNDIQDKIFETYKQQEIERLTKKKEGFFNKLGKEFQGLNTSDKMERMLGTKRTGNDNINKDQSFTNKKIDVEQYFGRTEKKDIRKLI
jgi:hypothetical protein